MMNLNHIETNSVNTQLKGTPKARARAFFQRYRVDEMIKIENINRCARAGKRASPEEYAEHHIRKERDMR